MGFFRKKVIGVINKGMVGIVIMQDNVLIKVILFLVYQSFGVVYGDLSILFFYVYCSIFLGRLGLYESDDEIIGVLFFIFYILIIIFFFKYVFIVLNVSDNGEGV